MRKLQITEEFWSLYLKGYSRKKISKHIGIHVDDLPLTYLPPIRQFERNFFRFYAQGLNDKAIAKKAGAPLELVRRFRGFRSLVERKAPKPVRISSLKKRAEDLTSKELEEACPVNLKLIFGLEHYLYEPTYGKKLLNLIGPRGSGKTFGLRKALNLVIWDRGLIPVMFTYRRGRGMRQIPTSALATRRGWGKNYETARGINDERIDGADIVVVDEVHYMFDDVCAGKLDADFFVSVLEMALEWAQRGKRVIISSADSMAAYSPILRSERFDALLPRFGFGDIYQANFNALAKVEVTLLNQDEWEILAEGLGLELPSTSRERSILRNYALSPRALVALARITGHWLTIRNVKEGAIRELKKRYPHVCRSQGRPRHFLIKSKAKPTPPEDIFRALLNDGIDGLKDGLELFMYEELYGRPQTPIGQKRLMKRCGLKFGRLK